MLISVLLYAITMYYLLFFILYLYLYIVLYRYQYLHQHITSTLYSFKFTETETKRDTFVPPPSLCHIDRYIRYIRYKPHSHWSTAYPQMVQ